MDPGSTTPRPQREVELIHDPSPAIRSTSRLIRRVVAILDVLEATPGLHLTEIARATGIPKPSCHRLLHAMQAGHLVVRDGLTYSLGPRLMVYTSTAFRRHPLRPRGRPWLRGLTEQTGLVATLSVRCGGFRLTLGLEGDSPAGYHWASGSLAVLYAGAASKVLVAWLPAHEREELLSETDRVPLTEHTPVAAASLEAEWARVRRQGWASSVGERIPGVFSVAVPVLDESGRVVAALAVSGRDACDADRAFPELLGYLWPAGEGFSRQLGFSGSYPPRQSEYR